MTKVEMLQISGLTDAEFKELVRKFQHFLSQLDPAQLAAVHRWMPTAPQIAKSLGPDVTVNDLADVVGADPTAATAIAERGVGLSAPNPGP
jgi:hypothetical protein